MNVGQFLMWLLGRGTLERVDRIEPGFSAAWAHDWPGAVLAGGLALVLGAGLFYGFVERRLSTPWRIWLGVLRGLALLVVLLALADPVLSLHLVEERRPLLWVLLDRSDSMALVDQPDPAAASKSSSSTPRPAGGESPAVPMASSSPVPLVSRAAAVEHWLRSADKPPEKASQENPAESPAAPQPGAGEAAGSTSLLRELSARYRVRAFAFGDADTVGPLAGQSETGDETNWSQLADDYVLEGATTAIGSALEDLSRRQSTDQLAGVLLLSDFDQNAGVPPVAAARKLGVPLFAVGLGARAAADLTVDLLAPPTMKKGESSTLSVTLRQQQLKGLSTEVRLSLTDLSSTSLEPIPIASRTVTLDEERTVIDFPFTPSQAGQWKFSVEVEPLAEETVVENNRSERSVKVIDDFLRLMFVEYEPTWEWRFVKEVFHRDRLVGQRGFRTYLRSADPVVRENNPLFLPSLTMARSEFFESDVIFLGDLPASALSGRFCEMAKEFVSQFGGGLVVIAGPRFGVEQLSETPLADILPVVVESGSIAQAATPFRLRLSPLASQFDFMRIGERGGDVLAGWDNLGPLNWYQKAVRVDPRATTVLAEHPTDRCADGRTPQPLIAVRQYGRGEVVYLAMNEFWRLRRLHGEEYYRQFWGQMIHRLGLSHALGQQKRFLVRTDRQRYRSNEQALVTVEAYDRDFEPLTSDDLPNGQLQGELLAPSSDSFAADSTPVSIGMLRPGVFEVRLPVFAGGQYRLRVTDPISGEPSEVQFEVASVSLERRSAVRNVALQETLAAETNGRAYEFDQAHRLLEDFHPVARQEETVEIVPLWDSWLVFALFVTLLMVEWTTRKLLNLA